MRTDSNVGHINTPGVTMAMSRDSSKTFIFGAVTFGTSSRVGTVWVTDRDSQIKIVGSDAIFGGDAEALSSIRAIFEVVPGRR
jgi:hypothetical protein